MQVQKNSLPHVSLPITPTTKKPEIKIKLLGNVEIYRNNELITNSQLGMRKSKAILCFLASRKNKFVPTETLIEEFWPGHDMTTGRNNLFPSLAHIRKSLDRELILWENDGYLLNPRCNISIDSLEFDILYTKGKMNQSEVSILFYEQAETLYRGDFMLGWYQEWAEDLRCYYEEKYKRLLQILIKDAVEKKVWEKVIDLSQKFLFLDQYCEEVHCNIMRAYSNMRNKYAVREQYARLQHLLKSELGCEPDDQTQELYQTLLR